jgi:geranylgeranyl diphosphate synthase, type II
MLSLEKAQEIIDSELEKLQIPGEPEKLYEPVRYVLNNGGKRIRPALVLLACDLFGADYQKAIFPALGIEVFHNFTLLHDDLMDNSFFRRNRPTVHVKWNPNIAILSGDVMSIMANNLICMADSTFVKPVSLMFNRTAIQVCEGQMLDMEYSQKESVSIAEYINMIGLKTSVLIAASLAIGAIVAEAPENDSMTLYNFGMNLGLAFQIQDDLLDSFGDQEVFGKKIGNDILTNKRTFLLIKAFEKAEGKNLDALKRYFSDDFTNSTEKINGVLNIFKLLDIKKTTEEQIKHYYNIALEYLTELQLPEKQKKEILRFSAQLMKRIK